jgi:hypothetical protein
MNRQSNAEKQRAYRERLKARRLAGDCSCGRGAIIHLNRCSQCLQEALDDQLASMDSQDRAELAADPAREQAARAGGAVTPSWNPFDAMRAPGVQTGTWSLGSGMVWDKDREEERRRREEIAAIPPHRRPVPFVDISDDPMYAEPEKSLQDAPQTTDDDPHVLSVNAGQG